MRREFTQSERGKPLAGQVALLTDGAHFDSRSLAVSLAKRGAHLVIVYRQINAQQAQETKELVEAEGRRCLTILSKSEDSRFAREIVRQVVARLGRLDIFIDYSAMSRVSEHEGGLANGGGMVEPRSGTSLSRSLINAKILTAAMTQMLDPERTER
jgi:NAD(P)-dependent dehydrogenase (short-subunit alcohol dehydrogenase family)